MHAADPSLGDGVYPLDGPKRVDAYCDMSTEGGGWTLVGRSVENATGAFGWTSARGDVNDDSQPYVLDRAKLDVPFTEGLVGTHDDDKSWKSLYRFTFPAGFPVGFDNKAAPTTNRVFVATGTGCNNDFPTMLHQVGWLKRTDTFAFRDNGGDGSFGLQVDGFWLNDGNNSNCGYSGKINGQQGMLMVR